MKRIALIAVAMLACMACGKSGKEQSAIRLLEEAEFNTVIDGKQVTLYTLTNSNGMTVQLTNYGARVAALWVPDRNGTFHDVVLGYESIDEYLSGDAYAGPVVGRYGNRIREGRFTLDGKSYELNRNEGKNHLHGGSGGWWSKVWEAGPIAKEDCGCESITFSLRSPDGEQGYPGTVDIRITYLLSHDNTLALIYEATTDAPTVLNPTSHCYFNLHGSTMQSTDTHLLEIRADSFTPTDAELIPTGEIVSVEGTPLDFRTPTPIGQRIDDDFEALHFGKGYDHNFVLNRTGDLSIAAIVTEPSNGIRMTIHTNQPGLQFYSGNGMTGNGVGKWGNRFNYRSGIALETQNFPDAPNHPNFPSSVLRPGETYRQLTVYGFDTVE